MRLLVGIVTRGRADLAARSVRSALAQRPPPTLVTVIEDGQVGPRFEWARSDHVQIERRQEQRGYLAARIDMMRSPGFDYFVSLDDDAWFIDGDEIWLAVRAMEKNGNVAAIAFDILSPTGPHRRQRSAGMAVNMFIGCGHALRLSAALAVGGYDLMPGGYGGEERDLCLKLLDRGWTILKLPGVHVWHEKTEQARDRSAQRRAGTLNDLTLIWRRCPTRHLIPRLLANICSQVLFALRQPGAFLMPTLAGVIDFVCAWPRMRRSRSPVRRETWARYRGLR